MFTCRAARPRAANHSCHERPLLGTPGKEKEERSYDRLFEKAGDYAETRKATEDISAAVEAEDDFM